MDVNFAIARGRLCGQGAGGTRAGGCGGHLPAPPQLSGLCLQDRRMGAPAGPGGTVSSLGTVLVPSTRAGCAGEALRLSPWPRGQLPPTAGGWRVTGTPTTPAPSRAGRCLGGTGGQGY